jgi:hypothetical protein
MPAWATNDTDEARSDDTAAFLCEGESKPVGGCSYRATPTASLDEAQERSAARRTGCGA